jgi:putative phosphoesterase
MKIAVFSDVHANAPALKAVVEDAKQKGAQEFWDLGDSVGYSPFPNEVLACFRQENVKSILGNYDQKVLAFPVAQKKWRKEKAPAKYFSFQWASRCLSRIHKRYLRNLPEQRRMRRGGIRFLLVHASPLDSDEIVDAQTPLKRFLVLAKAACADVVLCGHSHFYLDKRIANTRFINPGSVGRSFDGKQRVSYAMLDIDRGKLTVKRYRLSYDVEQNLTKMRQGKFPSILIDSIRLGRSIDELEERRRTKQHRVIT